MTAPTLLALVCLVASLDVVHIEGDHTSYLVLAPGPTPRFAYGGGEEGAWRRSHPGSEAPWWLVGHYIVLLEVTDG